MDLDKLLEFAVGKGKAEVSVATQHIGAMMDVLQINIVVIPHGSKQKTSISGWNKERKDHVKQMEAVMSEIRKSGVMVKRDGGIVSFSGGPKPEVLEGMLRDKFKIENIRL